MAGDRDLSEAAFHAKYGYIAGWDDARDMVYTAWQAAPLNTVERSALLTLWESMSATTRTERYDEYAQRIDPPPRQ